MSTTPDQLLDELVGRWTRGEPLAVDELLTRAGPRSDELATLIDSFLERAPRREPSPEAWPSAVEGAAPATTPTRSGRATTVNPAATAGGAGSARRRTSPGPRPRT